MEHLNKKINHYILTKFIGEGGMASVYEATHEKLGTRVAVKILNPILTANAQIRVRFENEAKLMASLNHPNITKVVDYEDQPAFLAFVMELLEGEDLSTLIKTKGALSPKELLPIFTQILDAFQYAHEKGIVHRDIKPSNIFISPNNQVKILDFGIAKIFGSGDDLTSTGMQMGTPVYMSPEQVKTDKTIDNRSDIYSLGVTLFFALNGKPPYDSETQSNFEIFNKVVYEPIPDLIKYPEINEVIKKACAKDRNERFRDANEFKKAIIESFSGNKVVLNQKNDEKTLIDYNPKTDNSEKTIIDVPSEKIKPEPKIQQKPTIEKEKVENKKNRKPIIFISLGTIAVLSAVIFALYIFQPWRDFDAEAWTTASSQNSIESFSKYQTQFPNGKYFAVATDRINQKKQTLAFVEIQTKHTIADYEKFLAQFPKNRFEKQISDSILNIKKRDSIAVNIAAINAYNNTPEGKAELLVLGKHPLTLQWIDWERAGSINIVKENGVIKCSGMQKSYENNTDYVKVDGTIKIANSKLLIITGTISTKIHHINNGDVCSRSGTFNFKSYDGRQYWRLQEMTNPCDGVTDYVDIYFGHIK